MGTEILTHLRIQYAEKHPYLIAEKNRSVSPSVLFREIPRQDIRCNGFFIPERIADESADHRTCFVVTTYLEGTITKKAALYGAIALAASVVLQAIFQYLADRLQSAAGYMIFADMRMKLGEHLRRLPMGYFTEGNIGKISSVLSTDMVFIEENCMMVLADMMSYLFSQAIMIVFMFFFDWRLGVASLAVTGCMVLLGRKMMKSDLVHSDEKQQAAETQTQAVLDFTDGIGIIKTYNLLGEKSKELTDRFDTVIGEGGASLSGGQAQHLSIARCILKDSPIVILDEATASVYADNESYIQQAISELCKGKTLLIIAHRLNTITGADNIMVIKDGQIAESGSHDSLMQKSGIYHSMVTKRAVSTGWKN